MKSAIEKTLFKSGENIISIKADGTVLIDSYNPAVEKWNKTSVEKVCAEFFIKNGKQFVPVDAAAGVETFFLISDSGDVIQIGQNTEPNSYGRIRTESWTDIAEISAVYHAVGLRKDGKVVATGYNEYGQCAVDNWSDIKTIKTSLFVTAGLKNDGTVVVCGETSRWTGDVNKWKNIKDIFCENDYLLGVDVDGKLYFYGEENDSSSIVAGWENVYKAEGNDFNIAALNIDGTVKAVGYKELEEDVKSWKDIVDITFATYLLVGLDKNGKVFVAGNQTVNHFSSFENKIWEKWDTIFKIVSFNSGFIGLKKDGTIEYCFPDLWEFNTIEDLSKARKWKCFDSYETLDEDYATGFERVKEKMAELCEKAEEIASESAMPVMSNTWLGNTLSKAKTDQEKMAAMEVVCRRLKAEKQGAIWATHFFRVLLFINLMAVFFGIAYKGSSPEELAKLETIPGLIKSLFKTTAWIFDLFNGFFSKLIDLFKLNMTPEKIEYLSIAITGLFLIFVLTPVLTRVFRRILKNAYSKSVQAKETKWKDPKDAAEETFEKLEKHPSIGDYTYSSVVPSVLFIIAVFYAVMLITGNITAYTVIGVAVTILLLQLLLWPARAFARYNSDKDFLGRTSDVLDFEKYWASFDPEKNEELELRAEAEEAGF